MALCSPTSIRVLFTTTHERRPKPSHHRLLYKPRFGTWCAAYVPNRVADPNYVRVFDTSLRDGEQAPGAAMTSVQKLVVARQLARLRVDVIEAGFPAASEDDFAAVSAVAEEVGNAEGGEGHVPVVCGLARCRESDVRTAWEAVRGARLPRIHTFIATSEIHRKYKLRMSQDEVVELARSTVSLARSLGCDDVEFSPEDAGRTDREFLYHILGEAIKAGATTLTIPDTVGYTLPFEFGKLIADIKANTPGIENVILSTHCHNDLGLATGNTLAGALAGARQVHLTINGIGERAGNASLEEFVMALKCRGADVLGGLHTGIDSRHIVKASKMVEEYSGLRVQPHKAIVGANAFAHQSGIHQDGMIKHKDTYEIISPEEIGLERSNNNGIVLGKLSGRNALKMALQEIVTKADLVALISDQPLRPQVGWQLGDVQVSCGALGLFRATVKLVDADGKEHISSSVRNGPVESTYKAVDLVAKAPVEILKYSMNAESKGINALATTRVRIRSENTDTSNHETFSGTGTCMNFVVSSVNAYIEALNNMLYQRGGATPEPSSSSPSFLNNNNTCDNLVK